MGIAAATLSPDAQGDAGRVPTVMVGGIEPFSLSDFPGTVAAVIFTQGCNFRCPYCHNKPLIPMRGGVVQEKALAPVLARKGRVQGVVVSGGEPTIQPGLPAFLFHLKEQGFKVKLDTNGSNPEVVERLVAQGLLDFIAMDIKAPASNYSLLTGVEVDVSAIKSSIAVISSCGVPHLFRTTWDKERLTSHDIHEIREMVPEGSPFRLQECRPPRL